MKINKFVASGVHGYLNFDVRLYDRLSFLVGHNGSGKTTILKLMQALLTPSIPDLMLIQFTETTITCEEQGKLIEIVAKKNKQRVELKVSTIADTLVLPFIDVSQLEYLYSREHQRNGILEEYQIKYSSHETFKYISEMSSPLFLGLDRTRNGLSDIPPNTEYEREAMLMRQNMRRGLSGKRIFSSKASAGLMETQLLVQESYRRLRRIENQQSEKLREKIFLSAFKYHELSEFDLKTLGERNIREQRKILFRKSEIESALEKIGLSGDKIKKVLQDFFRNLEGLFDKFSESHDDKSFPLEWIINKSQIDQITDLIGAIDEEKSQIDKLYKPINTFLEIMNSFYADTGKALLIDTVGQMSIMRPDKQQEAIEVLSSGETQLLIIFAHLIFNKYGSKSKIFVIDEPELSLHLKWQEEFVQKAVNVNEKAQFILATHSPEIISDYAEYCIEL